MIQGIHQQSANFKVEYWFIRKVSFSNLTILDRFNLEIKQNEMYSENSNIVGEILNEMATGKIVSVGMFWNRLGYAKNVIIAIFNWL